MEIIYYIKDSQNSIVKVSEEVALENKTYGIEDPTSKHIFMYHTECEDICCNICNLDICMVCGSSEGSLTTECSGNRLEDIDIQEVYRGIKDYRFGRWIKGVVTRFMTKSLEDVINNKKIIMEEFKYELIEDTQLTTEILSELNKEIELWSRHKRREL